MAIKHRDTIGELFKLVASHVAKSVVARGFRLVRSIDVLNKANICRPQQNLRRNTGSMAVGPMFPFGVNSKVAVCKYIAQGWTPYLDRGGGRPVWALSIVDGRR
jgi:hypothetical protein